MAIPERLSNQYSFGMGREEYEGGKRRGKLVVDVTVELEKCRGVVDAGLVPELLRNVGPEIVSFEKEKVLS